MIAPSPERTSTAETPALEPEPVETFTAAELLEIILDACVHLDPKNAEAYRRMGAEHVREAVRINARLQEGIVSTNACTASRDGVAACTRRRCTGCWMWCRFPTSWWPRPGPCCRPPSSTLGTRTRLVAPRCARRMGTRTSDAGSRISSDTAADTLLG